MKISNRLGDTSPDASSIPDPDSSKKDQPDLFHIVYAQSAVDTSAIEVNMLNMTAFVSLDAILDLTDVLTANVFAVMEVISASPPTPSHSTTESQSPIPSAKLSDGVHETSLIDHLSLIDTDTNITHIQPPTLTMNVVVNVTNPRLILLEDPTMAESRAIVGSCGVVVHYSRSTTGNSLVESLHISVRDNRVFILPNMAYWKPQPVLEPMTLEINLKKKTVDGCLVSCALSLVVDDIVARVALSDIYLAQSVMTRRGLLDREESAPLPQLTEDDEGSETVPGVEDNIQPLAPSVTAYTVSLDMGAFSLIGINDSNGQNIPIVRGLLGKTTFNAEGTNLEMEGQGVFVANADFYNPKLSLWEPVLDQWYPSLSLSYGPLGTKIELNSMHTMQVTVSGIMLEKVLQTYSLLLRDHDDDTSEREELPGVMVNNTLGSSIGIEVYDSTTSEMLMSLKDGETKGLPCLQTRKELKYGQAGSVTSSAIDLHFLGEFGKERLDLHHLPFNVNKPHTYRYEAMLLYILFVFFIMNRSLSLIFSYFTLFWLV